MSNFIKGIVVVFFVMSAVMVEMSFAKVNIIDVNRMGVFKVAVLRNQKPVVVYFTNSPCPYCKSILNNLENIARANEETMYLARVDLDQDPELRKEFGITTVPTTRTYYKGELLREVEGPLWYAVRAITNNAIKLGQETNPKQ